MKKFLTRFYNKNVLLCHAAIPSIREVCKMTSETLGKIMGQFKAKARKGRVFQDDLSSNLSHRCSRLLILVSLRP